MWLHSISHSRRNFTLCSCWSTVQEVSCSTTSVNSKGYPKRTQNIISLRSALVWRTCTPKALCTVISSLRTFLWTSKDIFSCRTSVSRNPICSPMTSRKIYIIIVSYSFCGSPEYMAPEMLLKVGHNYLIDCYCLGALLYELVTGLPPFYS
jgi:serine/threonine protein kinase